MKKNYFFIFLFLQSFNIFSQTDSIKRNEIKIGINTSALVSGSTSFIFTSPSFNVGLVCTYKNHNASFGLVISQKRMLPKGYSSWSPDDKFELDGCSFHYRYIFNEYEQFIPLLGYNFNYIRFSVGGTKEFYSSITNYESLITTGLQINLSKKINFIPEIGLGHRFYNDIYYHFYSSTIPNTVIDWQSQRNVLSCALKLSLTYNFN